MSAFSIDRERCRHALDVRLRRSGSDCNSEPAVPSHKCVADRGSRLGAALHRWRSVATFFPGTLLATLFLTACISRAAGAQAPDASVSQSRDEPHAQRIVSLAPNLTELVFAAGAGDRIVGTPQYSDYPQAARSIPRIGDAFRFDFERVLALRPDVVLAWEPGTPAAVVERLRALQLRVVTIATWHIADIPQAVRELGRIAGTTSQAARAAATFESDIAALRRQYGGRAPISVFLQVNDQPLYTVNGKQIMSEIIGLCGGRNVFGDLNDLAPQVGVEAVLAADPQAIISTGNPDAAAFKQWQHWPRLKAVSAGNLFTLPPDDLARSTTRVAAGAAAMCRTLETARQHLGLSN